MTKFKVPDRIRYEYSVKKDSKLEYAHGVWGGINPHGEIELNFYTESDKIPSHSERVISPDGSIGHEMIPFDDEQKIVQRDIHSRVVLNYTTARAVYEWLDEKLSSLEAEWDAAAGGEPSFFGGGDEGGGLSQ